MDALGWAYAVEYAKKQQQQKPVRKRASKKAGWALFFWFFGIGL
jgi:hypothetical protein